MKKFVLLLTFLMVLLFVLPASAEIERETDDFDGKLSISSDFDNIDQWKSVILHKNISNNYYQSIFFKLNPEWWFFSSKAEIKIDSSFFTIKSIGKKEDIISSSNVMTCASYEMPDKIINLLKKAKKVSFRINFTNQPSQVWEVPDYVLAEWKEVIKTTK